MYIDKADADILSSLKTAYDRHYACTPYMYVHVASCTCTVKPALKTICVYKKPTFL